MANFSLLFQIGSIISVVVAAISAISTSTTLLLITDINKWNTYMLLIFHLTACQFVSDVAFFFVPVDTEETIYFQLQVFFFSLGAVSVSLWTNVIACSLFSVVMFQENLKLGENFHFLRLLILIPSLMLAIMFAVLVDNNYEEAVSALIWLLFSSILFNVFVHCAVSRTLHQMRLENEMEEETMTVATNSLDGGQSPVDVRVTFAASKINLYEPIMELARRLQYYPVVQIIAILGQMWYFLQYNLEYFGPSHDETLRVVAWFVYSILTPSTGFAYFIVFLNVQPYAYTHFCSRLRQFMGTAVDRNLSIESDTTYREPSTTAMRVTDELPERYENYSVDSDTTHRTTSTNQGWSHFSGNTVSTMDDEALMRRIRDTHRANQALQNTTVNSSITSNSKSSRSPSMVDHTISNMHYGINAGGDQIHSRVASHSHSQSISHSISNSNSLSSSAGNPIHQSRLSNGNLGESNL